MAKRRDAAEAVLHLDRCARRAWGAAFQALESFTAWKVLNDDNDLRAGLKRSRSNAAAALIQNVLVEHQIVALIRLFDSYSYDRLSFCSAREHLAIPGVSETLEIRARGWPGRAETNVEIVRRCILDFNERLARLENEEPNRQRRLRHHRDQNIAHELHFAQKRPAAYYSDVEDLLQEAIALTNDLALAVQGHNPDWETRQVQESVRALWSSAQITGCLPESK